MSTENPSARINRKVLTVAVRSLRERCIKEVEKINVEIHKVTELEKLMLSASPPLSYEAAVDFEEQFSEMIEDFKFMKEQHLSRIAEFDKLIKDKQI